MSFIPKIRDYPKTIEINGVVWKIKFKRMIYDRCSSHEKNKEMNILGICDPETKEILIKQGQGKYQTYSCLFHELVHAIEFSYDFKILHKHVYNIEDVIMEVVKLFETKARYASK